MWGVLVAALVGLVLAMVPGPGPMFAALGVGLGVLIWPRSKGSPSHLVWRLARWLGGIGFLLACLRLAASFWVAEALQRF